MKAEKRRREILSLLGNTDNPIPANTLKFGILKSGDEVVTTVAEHNSVLRPLEILKAEGSRSATRRWTRRR